jgi:hypothetical protein
MQIPDLYTGISEYDSQAKTGKIAIFCCHINKIKRARLKTLPLIL